MCQAGGIRGHLQHEVIVRGGSGGTNQRISRIWGPDTEIALLDFLHLFLSVLRTTSGTHMYLDQDPVRTEV